VKDVSPDSILAPHNQRTVERMNGHKVALAIQDTTFFNFTHHPETQGLGEIGVKGQNQRGFGLYSTLAGTPIGQPLGVLTQAFLERPIGMPQTRPTRQKNCQSKKMRVTDGWKRLRKRSS